MARRLASIAVAIFGIFFITSLAWAVAVKTNVINEAAKEMPEITLTLTLNTGETRTATTGVDGTAIFENVPKGKHTLQAKKKGMVTKERVVKVGDEDVTVDFTLFPIFAWMVQSPAGCFGCIGFGAGYAGDSLADMDITEATEIFTDFLFGNPFDPFVFTGDPNQRNRDFDNKLRVHAALAEFLFGLPKFPLFGTLFYPAGFLALGGGTVKHEVTNTVTRESESFSGNGPVFAAGVSMNILVCAACKEFVGVGYRFSMFDASVKRDQPLMPRVGVGTVLEENMNFSSHSHAFQVKGGTSILQNHLSPYVGGRITWYRATFDGNSLTDFGGGFTSRRSFSNEFKGHIVQAVFGFDGRFPGSPVFVRAEGATDGSNYSVLVKFVYGFGFVAQNGDEVNHRQNGDKFNRRGGPKTR